MRKLEKELELHEVEFHRREDCANYEGCLDESASRRWKSFSCLECAKYLFKPIEMAEIQKSGAREEDYPDGDTYNCGKKSEFARDLSGSMRSKGIKEFNAGHRVTG